jgi:pyruvate/2-oxoglutarate dehydrogenase complex dihydrolipoamide dehydrogenase (E3) component
VEREPDLLVIGGGAAGLSAARTGVRLGATTVLVERGRLGGDCTFTGCVPSKAVIEAARQGSSFADALRAARRAVEAVAATEDDDVVAGEGIEIVHGWASFRGPRLVDVDGVTFRPRRVVIATGAAPSVPPIPGLDRAGHLTNETLFELEAPPASLVVLGGGAIGCEVAQAFARLGVGVTLLEALPRLLPAEEPEASAVVRRALEADRVAVRTDSRVTEVVPGARPGALRVCFATGEAVEAAALLVAAGRTPATGGLGLDEAGIRTEGGAVVTDDTLATTAPGVFAAGDVTGRTQFTHAADEMGRIAAANALRRGRRRRFDETAVPRVTFTDPEVASVGRSEHEVGGAGARVAHLPMAEVDRAVVAGSTDGFVKLVAGRRALLGWAGGGRLLGATVVAERAADVIGELVLAVRTGMFVGRLAQAVHPYPTWSIAVRQAAAQFFVDSGGRRWRPARRSAPER